MQGAKGAERVKIVLDGDEGEPPRVWVDPATTTGQLLAECLSQHFAHKVLLLSSLRLSSSIMPDSPKGDTIKDYRLYAVSGDNESLLRDEELPYHVLNAYKKSKITVHFLLRKPTK